MNVMFQCGKWLPPDWHKGGRHMVLAFAEASPKPRVMYQAEVFDLGGISQKAQAQIMRNARAQGPAVVATYPLVEREPDAEAQGCQQVESRRRVAGAWPPRGSHVTATRPQAGG